MPKKLSSLVLLLCIASPLAFSPSVHAARCLFVSSYHQGYPWADGIEQGVREVLTGHCQIKQINMDTKRHKDETFIQNKAAEIKRFIDQWHPNVIIAADDNASKYLVKPHLKDSHTPVVFCGINWTVDEYGYPYSNTTGMVEVAPIKQLFTKVREILPNAKTGYYIGADTLTERKNYQRFTQLAKRHDLKLIRKLASTQKQWNQYYQEAQQGDFLVLGTKSGISDWDDEKALKTVNAYGRKLSLTVYKWQVKFAAISMHKLPQEHGRWAANSAIAILNGVAAKDIPIIPNQDWDMQINPRLLKKISQPLPEYIWSQGKIFDEK